MPKSGLHEHRCTFISDVPAYQYENKIAETTTRRGLRTVEAENAIRCDMNCKYLTFTQKPTVSHRSLPHEQLE